MLRLNRRQRAVLVEKVPDLANIAAGALVFGQVVGNQGFSIALALFGAGAWFGFMGLAILAAKEHQD